MDTTILAIDPGQEKVGLALIDLRGNTIFRTITPAGDFQKTIQEIKQRYPSLHAAVGNSTGREKIVKNLRLSKIPYTLVDEKNSSQEARVLFFKEYPPRGLRRILPLSCLFPEIPFDDFQAIVIGRRFLDQQHSHLMEKSE